MDIDLLAKMVKEIILDNDAVTLPGIGSFTAELIPSSFTDRGYAITPPYRKLCFTEKEGGDSLLTDFYAASNSVEKNEAAVIVRDFLSEMKELLKERKTMLLPGLGRLRATRENIFFFVPDEDLDIYPAGFGLEPVSLKSHAETDETTSPAVTYLSDMPAAETVSAEAETVIVDTAAEEVESAEVAGTDEAANTIEYTEIEAADDGKDAVKVDDEVEIETVEDTIVEEAEKVAAAECEIKVDAEGEIKADDEFAIETAGEVAENADTVEAVEDAESVEAVEIAESVGTVENAEDTDVEADDDELVGAVEDAEADAESDEDAGDDAVVETVAAVSAEADDDDRDAAWLADDFVPYEYVGRRYDSGKIILKISFIIVVTVLVLAIAYLIFANIAPDTLDRMLYTPEELEIIRKAGW